MKKIIALVLSALLLLVPFTTAFAAEIDLSGMSAEELNALIIQARSKLMELQFYQDTDQPIYDDNGVKVTIRDWELDNKTFLLNIVVENNTNESIAVFFRDTSLNGWMIGEAGSQDIDAGKKKKVTCTYFNVDEKAEVKSSDELEDISFKINIYKMSDRTDIEKSFPVDIAF